MRQQADNGWRRLAAGAVDYGIVAAYVVLLGLVGALLRAAGLLPSNITTPGGRILGQLAAIAVLTLPVTCWFAWWEAAPRGATPGKRLLGLRVSRLDGGGLSWPRSLLRSALKIAVPWEVAHTGVWNSLAWPGPDAPVNALLFTVANGLLVLYVLTLFLGTHRPPYDHLAGTIVRIAQPARQRDRHDGRHLPPSPAEGLGRGDAPR
jgi:uncharacterized RDD family membrane protein YckC